ncbi:MAG: hypothetical protein J6V90_11155 [Treponema sp.]|nr:hypothetical protein [Treponema sp.]
MLAERALDIFACIALDEFKVCVSDSIRGRARFLDGELFRADGFQRDKFVNRNVIQPRQNDKIVEPWQSFTVGLRSIAARRLAQNAPLEHFAGLLPSLPIPFVNCLRVVKVKKLLDDANFYILRFADFFEFERGLFYINHRKGKGSHIVKVNEKSGCVKVKGEMCDRKSCGDSRRN